MELKLNALTKRFGSFTAVNGVSCATICFRSRCL